MKTMALFPSLRGKLGKAGMEAKAEPSKDTPPPCEVPQVDLDMLASARSERPVYTLPGLGWRYG